MFVSSFLGFIVSLVTVLAMQSNKQTARSVFLGYENPSGWSDPTSFVIGIGTCMYAYLAIDGACHISEVIHLHSSITCGIVSKST